MTVGSIWKKARFSPEPSLKPKWRHIDGNQISPTVVERRQLATSEVPVTCPLNHSPEKQKDPLAMSPIKGRPDTSDHSTNHLLALAAEALRMRLKPNWICVLDGKGIHTMQLSRNSEKCVQRRIYFNPRGDVHLSVHCVPIPISNFVSGLKMVKLHYQHDVSAFVAAMERVVNIVWQLEICTGVTHEKYKPFWASSTRGKIDENPYQEARYSVTLRSLQCCRLVRPRKRMCHSCARLLDTLRLKARSRAKKLQSHPMP
ncbi:uncharacterized protein LOC117652025 [Thrips palmi]|uniref:Uncharacterized protein LOC117652025 n=1 Tax=Thrips palmi TaxID=161013 RepID=A0A6P9A3W1_THRPL|nr:uncharacterized protein LOC117652025 [Thrips palmi]